MNPTGFEVLILLWLLALTIAAGLAFIFISGNSRLIDLTAVRLKDHVKWVADQLEGYLRMVSLARNAVLEARHQIDRVVGPKKKGPEA